MSWIPYTIARYDMLCIDTSISILNEPEKQGGCDATFLIVMGVDVRNNSYFISLFIYITYIMFHDVMQPGSLSNIRRIVANELSSRIHADALFHIGDISYATGYLTNSLTTSALWVTIFRTWQLPATTRGEIQKPMSITLPHSWVKFVLFLSRLFLRFGRVWQECRIEKVVKGKCHLAICAFTWSY